MSKQTPPPSESPHAEQAAASPGSEGGERAERADRDVGEYVRSLLASPKLKPAVAAHRVLPAADAHLAETARPWPRAIKELLAERGIDSLYSHQCRAADLLRSGRHVVTATPTASGKTMVYNLPVLEAYLRNPETRALYLFPLKALAQDQRGTFESLATHWPKGAGPTAAIYDGDTTQHFRRKIRTDPPNVLLTNPEMLHLSLLPYHEKWARFLASLEYVVIDEVHTYRGVLGAHMAGLLRRLRRVCRRFGTDPTFCFCSATVGNPAELTQRLTGLDVTAVTESGAPTGARHMVFVNPVEGGQGSSQTALQLLKAALSRELRTIVYTQSRKMAELISLWAKEHAGPYTERISAYRAGYLPEERRVIEEKMHSGELLAVISTSALELGIDIGALDLCILVGYPGTVMQTLQRGGRVGRAQRESAVVLVAGEDALDQYFMRHPEDFFARPAESAVVNPANEIILAKHLECAGAELPLAADEAAESWLAEPGVSQALGQLLDTGRLFLNREGDRYLPARKMPHRDVDLRGAGAQYRIELMGDGENGGQTVGQVDEHRAFKETHPGAVYLHHGTPYMVSELDIPGRVVRVARKRVDYYTRTRGNKETEILEVTTQAQAWGTRIFLGKLRVTERITGYEQRRVRGGTLQTIVPLELPPLVFETEGLWFEIPRAAQQRCEDAYLHFMGGIHALEHAAIGILPLLVMADRNDLGGISTPLHPQVGTAAVFIYDAIPGGVGLTRDAFRKADELFAVTLKTIKDCPCDLGCPSCVHSPKCGSGNRPMDKLAATFLLETMACLDTPQPLPEDELPKIKRTEGGEMVREEPGVARLERLPKRWGVLDVETRRSAQEVGGWHKAELMGVSIAVLYDSADETCHAYTQDELPEMFMRMRELELVIGFNSIRFDYKVLSAFTAENLLDLPSLDLLVHVTQRLGYRLPLDNLVSATLNAPKTADGLQALAWWKEGKLDEITTYCIADVERTRDLYLYGIQNGYVLFTNKAKQTVRLPVDW